LIFNYGLSALFILKWSGVSLAIFIMKDEYPDNIIIVKDLTKKFKNLAAVDGISFEVGRGEIFAFLGPNGAGKTTTIRMLITLLDPSAGEAFVDGKSIIRNPAEVRKAIGYVPQMISIDGSLTAYENLLLLARLYDIPLRDIKDRIRQTLSFLDMEKCADLLAKNFSGGMIRKLEIGQAMLHYPKVLFLDEPTTGLDPVAKRNVWERLLELRDKSKTTIFFSTHNMEEAENVSDRVAIMNCGKIAAIGNVRELKKRADKKSATLEDVFISISGASFAENGNFHEIKRVRQITKRLS
jgi:ABC-2 type transport system ATP-binding protein